MTAVVVWYMYLGWEAFGVAGGECMVNALFGAWAHLGFLFGFVHGFGVGACVAVAALYTGICMALATLRC
jgi:hypothetical protein